MTNQLKISLPFNQACKLKDDQKCKLIVCQAKRLALQEWEIESLLSICKSKGWVDKGLAILYEFAGYVDDVRSSVELYNDLFGCLLDEVEVVKSQNDFDKNRLCVLLSKCAAMTAKVIHIVCSWRRLQWCPRPLFFEDFVTPDVRLSLQSILRENSGNLYNSLLSLQDIIKKLLELNQISLAHLVLLLAPCLTYKEFINFLLGEQCPLSRSVEDSEMLTAFDPLSLVTNQHEMLFNNLNDVLVSEDKIEACWKKLHLKALSDTAEAPLADSFPVLRLPYKSFKPPTDDVQWFLDSIAQYTSLGNAVLSMSKAAESSTGSPKAANKYYKLRLEARGGGVVEERLPLILTKTAPVVFSRKAPSKEEKKTGSKHQLQEEEELRNIVSPRIGGVYRRLDGGESFISDGAASPTSLAEEENKSRHSPVFISEFRKSFDPLDSNPRESSGGLFVRGSTVAFGSPNGAASSSVGGSRAVSHLNGGSSLPEVSPRLAPVVAPSSVATPVSTHSKGSGGAKSKSSVVSGGSSKKTETSKSHDVLPNVGSRSGSNRSGATSPVPNLLSPKVVPGTTTSTPASASASVAHSKTPQAGPAETSAAVSTPGAAGLPVRIQPINNFMGGPESFMSPLTNDSLKFFQSPMAVNSPNFASQAFSPEQIRYYQQMQMQQQMELQQQMYRQQQILAYQQAQIAQQMAAPALAVATAASSVQPSPMKLADVEQFNSPLKSSNNAADLVAMTPENTQRKRSVTITLGKGTESSAKDAEHRRVTVSGPMGPDVYQAHKKLQEDEALRKLRVSRANGTAPPSSASSASGDVALPPSAMKKITPDSSRPVSGTSDHRNGTSSGGPSTQATPVVDKKEVSPPTIQEKPSQMLLKHRGESYNSIGGVSEGGEDEILYTQSKDPTPISGGITLNNSPFSNAPPELVRVRSDSGVRLHAAHPELYYASPDGQQMPPPHFLFSPGGYSVVTSSDYGGASSYFDAQSAASSAAYRGRVHSADAVTLRREQRLPASHRKSAPVKRKRTRSPEKKKPNLKPSGFTHVKEHGDLLRPKVDFLYSAFLDIEKKGGSLIHISACKIQVWWTILSPRLKLIKRIAIRETVLSILWDLVDSSITKGVTRQRKKRNLLRYGAAIKIQRCFRHWVATALAEQKRIDMEERVKLAWKRLLLWCRVTCVGIRIHRFLRWFLRKRPQPVIESTDKKVKTKKVVIKPNKEIRKSLTKYIQMLALYNKLQLHQQMVAKHASDHVGHNVKRIRAVQEREQSVIVIQKYWRRYIVRKHFLNRKVFNVMRSRIMLFFIRGIAQRRLKKKRALNKAATVIQTFFRGIKTRKYIYKMVSCGLKLNAMWRKHRAYKALKSQLRRVDKPHTIVVHGMRNIAKKFVSNDTLRFKLSVWWNPLLHIVSQHDFDTIIQSKSPQFIYNGHSHPVVDEDTAINTDQKFAFSRSLKSMSKASTSIVPGNSIPENSSIKSGTTNASQNQAAQLAHSASQLAKHQLADAFSHMPSAPVRPLKDSFSEIAGKASSPNTAEVDKTTPLKPSALLTSIEVDEEDEEEEQDSNHTPVKNGIGNYTYGIPEESEVEFETDGTMPVSRVRSKLGDSVVLSRKLDKELEKEELDKEIKRQLEESAKEKERSQHHDDSSSLSSGSISRHQTQTQAPSSEHHQQEHKPTIKRPSIFKRTTASFAMVRQSINYALHLGQNHRHSIDANKNPKFLCNFEDETIKIPGCHGNSVLKFEILEGERKFGTVYFYLSKEGDMMYWGGEYTKEVNLIKQRRAIQFNSHIIASAKESFTPSQGNDAPTLEFRVIAGAPLRSRCQWGRMVVKGNGPLKRLLNSKDMMSSFLFDTWHRFYFSIDEFTFDFYDNKFSTAPFFSYPVKDLKEVKEDTGAPIRQNKAASAKNIVEDITNVILTTYSGDELYMRFQDSGSRVAWNEVLCKVVEFNKKTYHSPKHSKHWLSKMVGFPDDEDSEHKDDDYGTPPSPIKTTGSPKQDAINAMAQHQQQRSLRVNSQEEAESAAAPSMVNNRSRMPPIFNVPHASKMKPVDH